MKYYWTRFSFYYPAVIIYMLQGSNYIIKDYLKWLHRSSDFRKVIRRRQLDHTIKAVLMLSIAWLVLAVIYVIAVIMFLQAVSLVNVILVFLSVLLFMVAPWFLGYVIIVPLWFGSIFIQRPHHNKLVREAKQIFSNSQALKIAIAGSFGKTTAKEVLYAVLSEGKNVVRTPGNMNTVIGISRFAQTLDGNEDVIIFELGEEKVGDVKELCELVNPDMGIITGVNEAHLSSFGTIDRTIATIFELQDYLGDKTLYKNIESPLVASKVKDSEKFAYNKKGSDGWRVSRIKTNIHGMEFVAEKDSKTVFAHSGLLGEYNVGIIATAISIADSVGLTISQIADGIKKTMPFDHRMQPRQLHGAWLIDDTYNGNSEGVQAGLLLLKSLEAKRRVYITPGLVEQGDKTKEIHEKIGRQIAKVADVVVLMQNSVTDYISNGLQDGKFRGQLLVVDNPLEFYTNLDHFVASGDVVLMQNDWPDNYV